jgi:protein TonB
MERWGVLSARALAAFGGSLFVFLFIPFIHYFFKQMQRESAETAFRKNIIMHTERRKPEKKKVRQQRLRKVLTKSELRRAQSIKFKFTPDLSVGSGMGAGVDETNLENVIFEEGDTDEPPVPIYRAAVPYPSRAKKMGIEGELEVILLINRQGFVDKVEFVRLPGEIFRRPALRAFRQWRFKPAVYKGVPVRVRAKQVINFRLEQ